MATSKLGLSLPFRATFSPFLSSSALESFIPGFELLKTVVLTYLGIDLTGAVGGVFLCVGFGEVIRFVWRSIAHNLLPYMRSTIIIPEDESSYDKVLNYVSKKYLGDEAAYKLTPASRTLVLTSAIDRRYDMAVNHTPEKSGKLIRYNAATTAGATWFVRNRRLFFFQRTTEIISTKGFADPFGARGPDRTVSKSRIVLRCLGWSTEPLQRFVDDCWAESVASKRTETDLYLAGDYDFEKHIITSRHMSTIDLDQAKKDLLIDDIANYLKPLSRKYYADRGIPLRRGYLFYGPPGTGKTSMSLALASKFGLPLYKIDLGASKITPDVFTRLFRSMKSNCIILLEDIDSAGIQREDDMRKRRARNQSDHSSDNVSRAANGNKISLSVLLNAIDGIGAQEGRVLIMTTNRPEALDSALKRPGRIDVEMYFGPATKETNENSFLRMFPGDGDLPKETLQMMAIEFASKIPVDRFTPAEVQQYLLTCKDSPLAALRDLDKWIAEGLKHPRRNRGATARLSGRTPRSGPSRASKKSAVDKEVSLDEQLADEDVMSAETSSSTKVEESSLFDKLDPSNTCFTEELSKGKGPASLRNIDVEKAKRHGVRGQNDVQKCIWMSPPPVILPQDARGMRRLSAYFDKFYVPKGADTDPEVIRKQQEVSAYFESFQSGGSDFPAVVPEEDE
jgi:chaperone BCS1